MSLRKLLGLTAVVALSFAFAIPPAVSQANPGGDVPGNPKILEDSADCTGKAKEGVTCTVLYGHIFNLLDAVPINTQFPFAQCADLGRGFTTVPTLSSGGGGFDQAKMDLYSSPGFVEYSAGTVDATTGLCDPRLHPERGITDDVQIDSSIPPVFYWYLSADTDDVSIATDDKTLDTGVMPCVEVTVILQTGRHFGQGTELSRGTAVRTMANTAQAAAHQPQTPAPDPCVEGVLAAAKYPNLEVGKVTEFPVEMSTVSQPIPKVEAFVIHVEWRQLSEAINGDNKFAQREWNVHTGSDFRNRLVLPVLNPVEVEEVRPQLFEDKIYIHGVFNSPWGSYDVDPSSLKVEILKPDGSALETSNIGEPILKFSVDHDAHFQPVNATFPWEYKKDNIQPGPYKIRLSAQNWQHTADTALEATIDFPASWASKPRNIKIVSSEGITQKNIVGKGAKAAGGPNIDVQGGAEEGGLPGFEGAFVLAALVGAAAIAARRRKA